MYLRHISSSIKKLHKSIIPVNAMGSFVIAETGKKYLDLTSGIGALSVGHTHPYVIKKVKEQLNSSVHLAQQIFGGHKPIAELNEKLVSIMPDYTKLDTFFYTNSGSESTDNAIKLARRYTNKTNIISMNGGFHGRTLGALSVTSSNPVCKFKSQPLIPGNFFCSDFSKESLDMILSFQSTPEETAAIICEPVLGESGVLVYQKIL